jgi:hypothetical protein
MKCVLMTRISRVEYIYIWLDVYIGCDDSLQVLDSVFVFTKGVEDLDMDEMCLDDEDF